MGQGLANPSATILSAVLMLDWLADTHRIDACATAARHLEAAVDLAFADGSLVPTEFGGRAGTKAVTDAVAARLSDGSAAASVER